MNKIRIFGFHLVSWALPDKSFAAGWIRFFGAFGPGIKFRDMKRTSPLFSERMKLQYRWHLGKWSIGYLKPHQP